MPSNPTLSHIFTLSFKNCTNFNVLQTDLMSRSKDDFNPLSPHDALKLHFTSLKTVLIFLQLRVLEQKFETGLH